MFSKKDVQKLADAAALKSAEESKNRFPKTNSPKPVETTSGLTKLQEDEIAKNVFRLTEEFD